MLLPNLCSLRERSNAELDGATSPCARAFPGSEYYGGSAPPGPFSGRRAYPGQQAGCPPAGNRHQAVPVFTVIRSAE